MTFSELVRKTRKEQKLTLDSFGAAVGVTRQAVSNWEQGTRTPDISFLLLIAARFSDWRREWANNSLAVLRPELFAPSINAA